MNAIADKDYRKNSLLSVSENKTNVKTAVINKSVLDKNRVEIKIQQYETDIVSRNYHMRISAVLIIFLAGVLCGLIIWYCNVYPADTTYISRQKYMTEVEKDNPVIDSDGFVFADSNERYLTLAEIEALQGNDNYTYQELLRYAINEIYARNGYEFQVDGKYYTYYNQYEWYRETAKQNVTYDMMNSYEQKNITMLVGVENELGYR